MVVACVARSGPDPGLDHGGVDAFFRIGIRPAPPCTPCHERARWRCRRKNFVELQRMSVTAVNRQRRKRATGIEPAWPAWKAGTLPLSYARERSFRKTMGEAGFEPAKAEPPDLQSG